MSPASLRATEVDLRALSDAAAEALLERIYPAHKRIFASDDRAEFSDHILKPAADRARLLVLEQPDGAVVGYCGSYLYALEVDGKRVNAWSTPMAVDRPWRGRTGAGGWLTRAYLRLALRHPGVPLYMVNTLVHPSSYLAMERQFANLHPHWERPMPSQVTRVLGAYSRRLGLDAVSPPRPWVRDVGGITRDTPPERDFWQRSSRGAARFFLRRNPGYRSGHGLLAAARLGPADACLSILRFVSVQLGRSLDRFLGRTGLASPVTERELRERVVAAPLFAGASPGAIDALLDGGSLRGFAPGERALRQGSAGRHIYIVVRGAAYAMEESEQGAPVILAELGPGEMFGEVSVILGRPRSASVRAAGSLWALEIPAEALEGVMALDDALRRQIQIKAAGCALVSQLLASPRFTHMDHDQRWAAVSAMTLHQLPAGRALELPGGRLVSVLSGAVELSLGGGWGHIPGGTLLRPEGPSTWLARADAAVAEMPDISV